MTELNPKARINLERAVVVLLDDTQEGIGVLLQIATAFGVKKFHRCQTVNDAQEVVTQHAVDLILASANLRESSGYDFVWWLRRAKLDPNSFAPAILLTGHTKASSVRKARDCGANFMVAKPVSPTILLERIVWVARENRPFVMCDTYVGPERRFRDDGPPEGMVGRRYSDLEAASEAVVPELGSGDEVEQKRASQ